MTTAEKLRDFIHACRREIAGELRADAYTRLLYSTDASLYQLTPHAVLIPRAAEDVVAAMALAAAYDVPVLARAAGTSLAGQAVNEALVIDFTRHLDAIVEINAEERWARAQPGVVLDELNAALRPHGLLFGPDPASSNRSTLGGAVANNATGSHSLLYGMTADHVRAMRVVLSDGSEARLDGGTLRHPAASPLVGALAALLADAANQAAIRDATPRYWRRCGGYNLDRLLPGAAGNLAQLICGSEGTLAVMTEITVDLVPRPAHTGLVLLHFDALDVALSAVGDILETEPAAVELLDTLSLTLCRDVPEYARLLASVVAGSPHSLLVVEYQAESEAAVRAGVERLERLAARRPLGVSGVTRALTPEAQAAVWAVRKVGLGLLMSMKGEMKPVPFIEDAAVPVAHLAEYVRQIEEYCAELGTPITYYAHAGAGCLHIRPLVNRRSAEQMARLPDIARFAAGLVKGYGGALSSEHGDGRSRSWLNEAFYGPELYRLFGAVKGVFDPGNRLNPGIIVNARPMNEHLRLLPTDAIEHPISFADYEGDDESFRIAYWNDPDKHSPAPPSTGPTAANRPDSPPTAAILNPPAAQAGHPSSPQFEGGAGDGLRIASWNSPNSPHPTETEPGNLSIPTTWHDPDPPRPTATQPGALSTSTPSPTGYTRAVELCNGAGVCRQRLTGTMCPSFMVTREEMHSTRGRANALRAVMTGALPPEEMVSPRMHAVMDLCISCKACKAECPSAVDMARLKTDFLARYHAAHGTPLRTRFFGHAAALNRLGSGPAAPLSGALLRSRLGRWVLARVLGLAAERPLPAPARRPFAAWWRRRLPAVTTAPAMPIALFIDPFTNYNHPDIAVAAVELFERIGVPVVDAPAADDGRPFISKGMVAQARAAARRTLDALHPHAAAGRAIVGLEPSSLLTLRDEYRYLLPDDERVAAVAARALTFEEYVDRLAAEMELGHYFTAEPRRVLLHGHCHQKALVGTAPARRVLSLPPGYMVSEVDSGCCGMAGSFGYEAEHYEVSMQMAERRLLPAVRAAGPETIIAAAGLSCREQIAHGTGRRALHPAEVLRDALR